MGTPRLAPGPKGHRMTWQAAVIGMIAIFTAPTVVLLWAVRARSTPSPNVIVHTRDDKSIEGIQLRRDGSGILLGAAKLLGEGAEQDVALTQTWVPIQNVRFVQDSP